MWMGKMNQFFKAITLGTAMVATLSYAEDDAMQIAMLRMQNQITELQNKLAESSGQIESLEHDLKLLQDENAALKQKLAAASSNVSPASDSAKDKSDENAQTKSEEKKDTVALEKTSGSGNATITPSDNKAKGQSVSLPSAQEKAEYEAAYKFVETQKYDDAVAAFKAYVEKYPEAALTPNAWYWMGQIQYLKKNYEEARVSFLHTAKFQNSNKRMDALYKLGFISKALGDNDKAKRFFEVLIQSYPNTTSATMAKKEIEALN